MQRRLERQVPNVSSIFVMISAFNIKITLSFLSALRQ